MMGLPLPPSLSLALFCTGIRAHSPFATFTSHRSRLGKWRDKVCTSGDSATMEVVVKDLEKHEYSAGETLQFELRNVDNSFANGLRRVLLSEVPTLAIDSVTILQNTSVFPDEMIAHRLGLLPIVSAKARSMHFLKDCPTKGCKDCEVKGKLRVSCSDQHHSRKVYASEIDIEDVAVTPVTFDEKGAWLLNLGRSQVFDCRFVIRKGIGKVHAKFQPVATVSMHFASDIRINTAGLNKLTLPQRQQWVDRCPRKVFELEPTRGQVIVAKPQSCIYCKECLSTEPPFDKLPEPLVLIRRRQQEATGNYTFTFIVESTGVLSVVQLLFDAVAVLSHKLEKIRRCLTEDEANRADVIPTRRIGGAPTAPVVVNEDVVDLEGKEDDLRFAMM